ncbi:hypothetical protein D3C85_1733390 [compost metagenome]
MVCAGIIIHRVLNELEARDTYRIKCLVICAAGIVDGYCFCTQIVERVKPFFKYRSCLDISL